MGNRLASRYRWAKGDLAKYHSSTRLPWTPLNISGELVRLKLNFETWVEDVRTLNSDKFRKKRSTGYVSLLILLLLTSFSGLGMESYLKANAQNRMVKRETQSRQALYLAEGGIEWAKAHLLINPGLRRGSLSFDTGQVDIVIGLSGGEYTVTSKGLSGLAVRKIEERLQLNEGIWVIKGYQELHW